MLAEPKNWQKYYHGNEAELRIQRHFSYSDRIRYYWPHPAAAALVEGLFQRLGDRELPETLVSQYLGALYPAVAAGMVEAKARPLALEAIRSVIRTYNRAAA